LTLQFAASDRINAYATYATAFKSVGVNLGGLPLDANNNTILEAAEVAPEDVSHIEVGFKASPTPNSTANLTLFNTEIDDFQTQVTNAQFGVARGLPRERREGARARRGVRRQRQYRQPVRAARLRGVHRCRVRLVHGCAAAARGHGRSGFRRRLRRPPAGYLGVGRVGRHRVSQAGQLLPQAGEFFTGLDIYYRSDFSSSPTPSQYLNVDGYSLLNLRLGFRSDNGGWSGYIWARNLLDEEYYEQLLAAPAGNGAGHYGAVLGDPLSYGATLRFSF
jgi:iron complex outermembrane receptor protein